MDQPIFLVFVAEVPIKPGECIAFDFELGMAFREHIMLELKLFEQKYFEMSCLQSCENTKSCANFFQSL